MKLVRAALLIFGAPKIGQHLGKAPAGIAELPPMVVILVLAADLEQAVDRTRSPSTLPRGWMICRLFSSGSGSVLYSQLTLALSNSLP